MTLRQALAARLVDFANALSPLPDGDATGLAPPIPAESPVPIATAVARESIAARLPVLVPQTALRDLLETCASAFRSTGRHVRANVMKFTPDGKRRRVDRTTAFNMENDPDRDLEMDATAGASGKAVLYRRAAIGDLVLLQITDVPTWGLSAEEQARVRPRLKSILSVPLFNPNDVDGRLLGTLQVDSDLTVEEAGFNQPEASELLQQFADVASLILIGVTVPRSEARPERRFTPPHSRVKDATQAEPGVYVANSSTSIFQITASRNP